jgi:hypothetical protein
MAATHTCVNTGTTSDGRPPPACVACSEEFTAKQTVRDQVLGRMIDQSRALAKMPCEFNGESCFGCATCYARETVRMLSLAEF